LVAKSLNNFFKLLGRDGILNTHMNHNSHKDAINTEKDFLKFFKNLKNKIVKVIDSRCMQLIKENCIRLIPTIETIIFLG
jgi:hypothetical protein